MNILKSQKLVSRKGVGSLRIAILFIVAAKSNGFAVLFIIVIKTDHILKSREEVKNITMCRPSVLTLFEPYCINNALLLLFCTIDR